MDHSGTITIEPGKRGGRACVRDPRIAVADVLGWLASGLTRAEILSAFPKLARADLQSCLAFSERMKANGEFVPASRHH